MADPLSHSLLEGPTLVALIAGGPMRPRDAHALSPVVARPFHCALNTRGICNNRDLTPSNFPSRRLAFPTDPNFGLASASVLRGRWLSRNPSDARPGAVLGTPVYTGT